MNRLAVLLLGLAVLLAPLFAATPEEAIWQPALAAVSLVGAALAALSSRGTPMPTAARMPLTAFAALLIWVVLSIVGTAATSHPATAYLDPMLRAVSKLASYFGIFAACVLLTDKRRENGYALLAFIIVGGGIAAVIGLQEYLAHLAIHDAQWRIFGTSSPDYLAAYLLLVFPITLAMALSVNERLLKGLLMLVALLEMATIFPTGSRFALLPLVLELLLFVALYLRAQKGRGGPGPSKPVAAGIAVFFVIVAATLGKPVIQRLTHNQANSGAFRLLTWKGSLRMAEAHPLIGAGIGTWEYRYQRYAEAGFTRVAHNSYLQLADDSGILAAALLAALIFATAAAGWRGARAGSPDEAPVEKGSRGAGSATPLLTAADAPLIIGLLSGTAAVGIQNLIDSDWYVFAIGATTAAAAGVMVGLSARQTHAAVRDDKAKMPASAVAAFSVFAAACAVFSAMSSAGAVLGQEAAASTHSADPAEAEGLYSSAMTWAPLNGRILGELGYRVQFGQQRNAQSAVETLKSAIALLPDSVSYRRLGDIYAASGQTSLAVDAYKHGLRAEPNSVDLLLDLARIAPKEQGMDYYRELARQEVSSVGQIRALGDITEARYGIADSMLADEAASRGNAPDALAYYRRAQTLLEKYADEGGSSDPQHMALSGGHPDPEADRQFADLYAHVTSAAEPLLPAEARPAYHAAGALGRVRFGILQGDALKIMGKDQEAQAAYAAAQQALQEAATAVQALPAAAQTRPAGRLAALTDTLKKRMAANQ